MRMRFTVWEPKSKAMLPLAEVVADWAVPFHPLVSVLTALPAVQYEVPAALTNVPLPVS